MKDKFVPRPLIRDQEKTVEMPNPEGKTNQEILGQLLAQSMKDDGYTVVFVAGLKVKLDKSVAWSMSTPSNLPIERQEEILKRVIEMANHGLAALRSRN